MSAALGLLRLQQVDTRIDQVESTLEQIRAALENDAELTAVRELVESTERERAEMDRARQEVERLATFQRQKLQQAESTLYGGTVRIPKELQDLQADVLSLKKHLATLEDTELQWMEKLELAERQCSDARQQMDHIQERLGSDHGRLESQRTELLRLKENLQTERAAAVSAVSAAALGKYAQLRQSRRGIAVAEIADNACSACGTVLTAALQQSARHALDLVHCPSCGRILYGG